MSTQVRRLCIAIDGVTVGTALLHEVAAPRTSQAVWDSLPWRSQLMHCTSSGECVFFAVTNPLAIDTPEAAAARASPFNVVHGGPKVEPENLTVFVSAGDLVLTPDKACIVVYGRRCSIRAYVGDLPSNAFAYVRDPDEVDQLAAVAKLTLTEGAKEIVISRVEIAPG